MIKEVSHTSISSGELHKTTTAIVDEVEKAIVGKRDRIEMAVLCLIAGGHLLVEDIPGVGKTTLAKALAKTMGGEYRRVQFTPDLLPADITGSSIFNQRTAEFEFRPGPVFANVVLADEINRATPKTQSALLEAMEEHQVTTDGETRPLPKPFFVIATQNSIEMTGTYPLPEAQLDRFFIRLNLGYPSRAAEAEILTNQQSNDPLETLRPVCDAASVVAVQTAVREIFVHESIKGYIVDIIRATRESALLSMGSSPRGSLHVMRAAQSRAAMQGMEFVRPDDVQAVAEAVLSHRVLARAEVRMRGGSEAIAEAVRSIVETVPAPPAGR